MRSLRVVRNDGPSTGDFYGGSGSDLGKASYARGNLAGFGADVRDDVFGEGSASGGGNPAGVAFGRFTFAEATIGLVAMVAILAWYAGRGMKA